MSIRRLKRDEINSEKWNKTIKLAYNSMPYGYTWYLDAVSKQWEALVFDDYQAVLPLPFIKKMGLKQEIRYQDS